MTLETCREIHFREFAIISFTARLGRVYRQDRDEFKLSTADNCTNIVLSKVRSHALMGHQVLVFESGAIKADWCRISTASRYLLVTIRDDDFRKMLGGFMGLHFSLDEFTGHVRRSFPE